MKQSFSVFIKTGACLLALLTFISVARGGFLYVNLEQNSVPARIYGYSVNETTGVLTALGGFPVTCGQGSFDLLLTGESLTIDHKNKRLYALDTETRKVCGFSINPVTGALTEMPFSPISLVNGHSYATVAVHPSGSPLVVGGIFVGVGELLGFAVTPTTATPLAGNPYPVGSQATTSVFSRDGRFFYAGGGFTNGLSAYSVEATTGALSQLPGSPYNVGNYPLGFVTDRQGRLFTATHAEPEILVFTTDAQGVPAPVAGSPFASGLMGAAEGVLHPNEQFYFVVDRSASKIGTYRINNSGAATTVSPVAGSPVGSMGAFPTSLVLNRAGTLLFVANGSSRNISTFNVNPATGVLSFNNALPGFGNGLLTGTAYLAAHAPLGGRVTDSNGKPISGALITATDEFGNAYTALTNPFGYYRFDELAVGATYTFTARQKQYVFAAQNYTVNENTNELNFTAAP